MNRTKIIGFGILILILFGITGFLIYKNPKIGKWINIPQAPTEKCRTCTSIWDESCPRNSSCVVPAGASNGVCLPVPKMGQSYTNSKINSICGINFAEDNLGPKDKTQTLCTIDTEYQNTALSPVSCACPDGYKFTTISISFGPCPNSKASDCPASTLKCTQDGSLPKTLNSEEEAIIRVKIAYPKVKDIKKTSDIIGKSMNISAKEADLGWKLMFWQGSGDCPSGCINNHYWYFIVHKNGKVEKIGEYERIYNSRKNASDETGSPIWDFLEKD